MKMFKKKILKVVMGMSVISIISHFNTGFVFAAPEDEIEAEDNTGTESSDPLPPADVKWLEPGKFSFKITTEEELSYSLILACWSNGLRASFGGLKPGITSENYKTGDIYVGNCADFFTESGIYEIRIGVQRSNNDDEVTSEKSEITWNMPTKRIAAPTNLHWENYTIVCDPVDGASGYEFDLYRDGKLIHSQKENENKTGFYYSIDGKEEHEYRVCAYAFSDNLLKYANSEASEMSPAYAKESATPKDGNETPKDDTPKDNNGPKEENPPKGDNDQPQVSIPKDSYPRLIKGTDGKDRVYKKGVEITRYTGLAILGATGKTPWVYVKDGKRVYDYNGYVEYEKSLFYVEEGIWKEDLNGVMVDPNSDPLVWYFNANGQVQSHHTGLAEYDSEWFYIENGKVATDMNAFVEYDGGLFAVGAGRIIREYNGLMQDPQDPVNGAWYFFADGQAQTQYTGLAQYDNAWFYIVDGKLATEYTGSVEYDGTVFNVVNGMVR